VSGGRLSGRGKGVANKQISQEADLYLQYVETGGCWYLVALEPFGDGVRDLGERSGWGLKKSVARTYGYSGRTWTLLIFLFRGGGGVERKAGWPGFPHKGKERAGTRGERRDGRGSLTKGRNGPGQGGKSGWPGFPHNGKERAGTRGKSGMAGVPSQWEGTGRDKGEKRDGRGSLTMGRNGPGQGEKAGWPEFPHNGKERAGTRGKSGMAGVPSQWEGTGRDKREKRDGRGSLTMGRNGPGQGGKASVESGHQRLLIQFSKL
jgi:hypothetical protein